MGGMFPIMGPPMDMPPMMGGPMGPFPQRPPMMANGGFDGFGPMDGFGGSGFGGPPAKPPRQDHMAAFAAGRGGSFGQPGLQQGQQPLPPGEDPMAGRHRRVAMG
jgi:hypothetical protein